MVILTADTDIADTTRDDQDNTNIANNMSQTGW